MSDIAQGGHANLILAIGDVYRVGTDGVATVAASYGAPAGTTTLTAQTQDFGPYAAPAKLRVTAVSGSAAYSRPVAQPATATAGQGGQPVLNVAGVALPLAPSRFARTPAQEQIAFGTYGDSLGDGGPANFDVRQIAAAGVGSSDYRAPCWVSGLSNGLFRWVANCGVGGETTTQMLAREVAGASASRKNISDMASCGARFAICSMSVNNYSGLAAGADVTAAVSAAVVDAVALLKRMVSLGVYPLLHAVNGYGGGNAAQNVTRVSAILSFNSQMGAIIAAAGGALGSWIDVRSQLVDSLGAYLTKYERGDGAAVHPNAAGYAIIAAACVAEMMRVAGVVTQSFLAYPGLDNLIPNADFSAATGGVATGVTISSPMGTSNRANAIVDWRGMNWQECIFTPTGQDVNGNTSVLLNVAIPNTSLIPGDLLGTEISLYIDDGSGGAPNAFSYCVRQRSQGTYSDCPQYQETPPLKCNLQTALDLRVAANPHVVANAAPSSSQITIYVFTCLANNPGNLPVRVRIGFPRAVRLPVGFGELRVPQRAQGQVISYAASITPDVLKGSPITIGALTGALTMAAPLNPQLNQVIDFNFTQAGAGSYAITWNAVFKKAADGAAGAAGTKATTSFVYDGVNWIQRGGALAYY